ncbi:MAG: GxxExxY protein [Deltaproteobacteria bacterium]|nr:GxxExxY protein [Deltaproteobacteria bacterium]
MSIQDVSVGHRYRRIRTSGGADRSQSDPQTYAVIGAAMEVHKELRCGFLERVYQEAMEVELGERRIPFAANVEVPIRYKSQALSCSYRADLVCFPLDSPVLVELKAREWLGDRERAQVIHYLRATGIQRALLINFGTFELDCERYVCGWKR